MGALHAKAATSPDTLSPQSKTLSRGIQQPTNQRELSGREPRSESRTNEELNPIGVPDGVEFCSLLHIASAEQLIVVADSTKFGHTSLAQMCPLEEIDVLVTDSELPAEWPERLAAARVKLVIAETETNGRPEARPT